MGHHILLSAKITLNAKIDVLVHHFYITTLTLLHSLRLQGGRGGYSPLSSTIAMTIINLKGLVDCLPVV